MRRSRGELSDRVHTTWPKSPTAPSYPRDGGSRLHDSGAAVCSGCAVGSDGLSPIGIWKRDGRRDTDEILRPLLVEARRDRRTLGRSPAESRGGFPERREKDDTIRVLSHDIPLYVGQGDRREGVSVIAKLEPPIRIAQCQGVPAPHRHGNRQSCGTPPGSHSRPRTSDS